MKIAFGKALSITKLLLFISLLSLSLCKNSSIVVIPFKINTINPNQEEKDYSSQNLIKDYFQRDMYGNLEIGTPSKKVLTLFSFDRHEFLLGKNYLERRTLKEINDPKNTISKVNYEISGSSTYKNISYIDFSYRDLKYGSLSSDTFTFYTSVNLNITRKLESLEFLLNEDREDSMSILIGLNKPEVEQYEGPSHLFYSLKQTGIVNDQSWTIKFLSKTDGLLIIGSEPHLYEDITKDPKYQKKFYFSTESITAKEYFHPWSLNFNKVFYESNGHTYLYENKKCYFEYNNGFIIGTEYYKENITNTFFKELLEKGICEYRENNYTNERESFFVYYSYSCDKNKFLNYYKKFPSISFYIYEYEYTFELTNKDLFVEVNDKYYFLIVWEKRVYPHPEDEGWYLGLPFLEKYQFVLNYDTKTIGYYIPQKKEGGEFSSDNSFLLKIIVGIILGVVLLSLAFILGKKWTESSKRKKRANELDDDFNYPLEKDKNEKEDK